MTSNADYIKQLSAYLDGELSEEQRREVEQWLERDPHARQILNDLRQLSSLVAELPRERAPAGLAESIRSQFERDALLDESYDAPASRRSSGWVRWSTRLGAVAVLLIGANLAWQSLWIHQDKNLAEAPVARELDEEDDAQEGGLGGGGYVSGTSEKTLAHHDEAADDTLAMATARRNQTSPSAPDSPRGMDIDELRSRQEKHRLTTRHESESSLAEPETTKNGLLVRRRMTALTLADTLDARLRRSRLISSDLANASKLSPRNRIVVETDAESARAMVSVIKGFMSFNSIPAVAREDIANPIPSEKVFYFSATKDASGAQEGFAVAASDDESVQDQCYVMNIAPEQAESLLESLDSYASRNASSVQWHANWVDGHERQSVDEIIASINNSFSSSDLRPHDERNAKAKAGMASKLPAYAWDTTTSAPAEERTESDTVRRRVAVRDGSEDDSKQPSHGKGSKASEDAPITLTVEIRAKEQPDSDEVLQASPPRENTPPVTTSQASDDAASTTQPTSQRSDGG